MLSEPLANIARAFIDAKIAERDRPFPLNIQAALNRLAIQGLGRSDAVVTTLSEICITESRARLDLVWSELKRVVTDARVALAPTLADELIAEFNQYLGSVLRLPKQLLETHIRNAGMVSPVPSNFDVLVEPLIAKVRAEIALFVLTVEKTPQRGQEVQSLQLAVTDDANTDLRQLRAFLSHSTQDKLLVSNLAKYLLAKGIDAWYAEWEIIPGDSLRRKVDEGIGKASHFLVILSPSSLRSQWVQTELDAGMVKRIEGTCTLIPVVYGLGDNDVPLTLRGIRWVRVELDQSGFKELADAILGLSSKPPLASLSAKTGDRSLQQLGLSENAKRLALLLSERSETGLSLDPLLGAAEVRTVLNLAEDQVAMAADELEEGGLVKLHHAVGEGNIGFFRISPTARFFIKTDPAIKGWHPNQDARALAAAILNKSNEGLAWPKPIDC